MYTYMNIKGDLYFLHRKKTAKNNYRYYFSKKPNDDVVDEIPDGYQVYENESGQVFLRKSRDIMFTAAEIVAIESRLKMIPGLDDYKMEQRKQGVFIYLPEINLDTIEGTLTLSIRGEQAHLKNFSSGDSIHFIPAMKVSSDTIDGKKIFITEQFQDYSLEKWIEIGRGEDLIRLVDRISDINKKTLSQTLRFLYLE